jgi:hypothetical protein
MRITSGGNIGIGTTSPDAKLRVEGTGRFTGSLRTDGVLNWNGSVGALSYGTGIVTMETNDATAIYLKTNGSTAIAIDTSQRVGIGITSPTALLTIKASATDGNQIYIVQSNDNRGWRFRAKTDGHFYLQSSYTGTDDDKFMIQYDTGNVGIGTSSAAYKLDVNGGAADTTLGVRTTGQNAVRLRLKNEERDFILTNNPADNLLSFNYDGSNRFQFDTANQWFNSGNVGIGTTSPAALLHVAGAGRFDGQLLISADAGNEQFIIRRASNNNAQLIMGFHSSGYGRIQAVEQNVGYRALALNQDGGNVGIGTTSPGYKLDVNGNQRWIFRNSSDEIMDLLLSTESSNSKSKLSLLWYGSETAAIKFKRGGDASGGELEFWTQVEGGSITQRMTIITSGNVGIGTTSPGYKLDVNAASTSDGLRVQNAGTSKIIANGDGVLAWGAAADYGTLTWDTGFARVNAAGSLDLRMTTSAGGLLVLKSGGNVGVGTTSPSAKLHADSSAVQFRVSGNSNNLQIYAWGGGVNLYSNENLYFGRDAAVNNKFYFQNTGATSTTMYIDTATGNVGIGTSSPGQKLSVEGGNIILNAANAAANYYLFLNKKTGQDGGILFNRDNANDWQFTNTSTGNLLFYSYGTSTEAITFQRSSGNVGIGTTSPIARLEVTVGSKSGTQPSSLSLYVTADMGTGQIGTASGNIEFRHSNASQGIGFGYNSIYQTGNNTNQELNILSRGAGHITLNAFSYSTGNVGIGTTAPADKLSVNGSISSTSGNLHTNRGRVAFSSTSGDANHSIYNNYTNIDGEGSWDGMKFNVYAGAWFRVGNASGATPTTAMYINSSGFVGIGTTSPLSRLDVYSSTATATAPTVFLSQNAGYGQIAALDSYHGLTLRGYPTAKDDYTTTAADVMSFFEYGGDFRFYKKNVSALTLQGRLNDGTWTVTGDVVAYGSPSDISLKTNIKPLEGALEKIIKLQGVSFTWKEDTDANKMTGIKDDIGFIAQEVQEVLPDLVRKNDNGLLSLRDKGITALLVEAIKELKTEVEDLKYLLSQKQN